MKGKPMKEEPIWNLMLCIPGEVVQKTLKEAGEPSAACVPYVLPDRDYMIRIDDWLQITSRVRHYVEKQERRSDDKPPELRIELSVPEQDED
jgi:hypothetical protein